MQKILPFVFFIVLLYCSCSEENSSPTPQAQKDSAKNQTFFPVTDYIRGQLNEIDSLPVTPLKIISYNGKQDSIWMKKEDIRPFAEPFLHPVIDTTNLKDLFTEKSFLDQTINAYTFSYEPAGKLPDTLQLKRWDVYIDPQKGKVKRIYIVKEVLQKDTFPMKYTLQLTWTGSKWCKITTITEPGNNQPAQVREELMKWDFSD